MHETPVSTDGHIDHYITGVSYCNACKMKLILIDDDTHWCVEGVKDMEAIEDFDMAETRYWEGWENIEYESSSILTKLEEMQTFLEEFDPASADVMIQFMAWFETMTEDAPTTSNHLQWEYVIEQFEGDILPGVIARYSETDTPAIRQAFNDFTDSLCKDGQITEWQYNNGVNPY